jgi:hypothetical protein
MRTSFRIRSVRVYSFFRRYSPIISWSRCPFSQDLPRYCSDYRSSFISSICAHLQQSLRSYMCSGHRRFAMSTRRNYLDLLLQFQLTLIPATDTSSYLSMKYHNFAHCVPLSTDASFLFVVRPCRQERTCPSGRVE